MFLDGETVRYSASDLANFLDGDFASWMDRRHLHAPQAGDRDKSRGSTRPLDELLANCLPDEADEELEILRKRGYEHEKSHLDRFCSQGRGVIEIPNGPEAGELTLEAMRAGTDVIFQARLERDCFLGFADFLVRCDGRSRFGNHYYEPWDTKLAKSPKPHYMVQLCAYAEMLEHVQGVMPERFVVVLGTNEERLFTASKYLHYFRELKRRFLEFHASFDLDDMPHPGHSRSHGRWGAAAQKIIEATDHLSLVAGLNRKQIQKLERAGIRTVADLVKTSKRRGSEILGAPCERIQKQAKLQVASRGKPCPQFQLWPQDPNNPRRGLAALPPASKLDVFFDMEGFPLIDGGLEYLFGAVYLERRKPKFVDWWAHDPIQEKNAFEQFIDWAHARWKADPAMHIYHYAAYEVAAVRRLMGKYATREAQVDDLLRAEVFVDLYRIVQQGLVVGAPSYSLKDVEKLYAPTRDGAVTTAAGSIVFYQRWLDSDEEESYQESSILTEIRNYNQVDCESTWRLAEWLWQLQKDQGVEFQAMTPAAASPQEPDVDKASNRAKVLSEQLLDQLTKSRAISPEKRRVQELLSWLLEFHWREAKPVFWRMFDRHEATEEELIDDLDCLGGLVRTSKAPQQVKRSVAYEYSFDPSQETKLHAGSPCFFAHDLEVGLTIESLDPEKGLVEIKLGPTKASPPPRLSLIPDEHVSAKLIADAVCRYVEAWSSGTILSRAVDDLLWRRKPRIKNHAGGSLVQQDQGFLPAVVDVVKRMDETVLCIQGPPGAGKTYTAATTICELLRQGKKIGVTANSHKAILNVLVAVCDQAGPAGLKVPIVKVGGDESDLPAGSQITSVAQSSEAAALLDGRPIVVGGTAWLFSREELEGCFDYLFVDEAGQFSLANVVGTGLSARNLVLIGDQMQLAQPILGVHPGESGRSALDYLLDGKATIPDDLGIFLGSTWRMHPEICDFISAAFYESRLLAHPDTAQQRLSGLPHRPAPHPKDRGIAFVAVSHEGNAQSSEEEIDQIEQIAKALLQLKVTDRGKLRSRPVVWDDLLFVAPFNMQVRGLQQRLGSQARVGSVDKFQGQEAHIVIVSMCSSSLEDSPRGAEFLLNPNRLNVAISRAKTLAIVVGSREITAARCQAIPQMELVNLYCWLGSRGE